MTVEPTAELTQDCESVIGYHFDNPDLLASALTHASVAEGRLQSNERMEFLGDAVLGLVICEQLYRKFPDLLEGEMTKIKSVLVSRRTCARVIRSLGLSRYLRLGKGMTTAGALPSSLLAKAFESLVAAIYLDGGMAPAREFILRHLAEELDQVVGCHHRGNYKSLLQQIAQQDLATTPQYRILDEKGPDHARCFKICAVVGQRQFEAAWGRNKKAAEQTAALNALRQLQADGFTATEDMSLPPESDD